jgi:hypothetical protein
VAFDNDAQIAAVSLAIGFRQNDGWLPLAFRSRVPARRAPRPQGVGRVKPGVSLEQARTGMAASLGVYDQYPAQQEQWHQRLAVYELGRTSPGPVAPRGCGLLLVIACTNLASLMLARAESRQRELAVRAALGPTRPSAAPVARGSRHPAGVGGAVGLGFAMRAARSPRCVRRASRARPAGRRPRVAAFSIGVVAPRRALRAASGASGPTPDLQTSLKERARVADAARPARRALVTARSPSRHAPHQRGAQEPRPAMGVDLGSIPLRSSPCVRLPNAAYPTPDAWIQF